MSGLSGIWIIADNASDATAELVTLAQQLASNSGESIKVLQSSDTTAETASQAKVLSDLAQSAPPKVILLSASSAGKDLAPRLAAQLNAAIVTNVQSATMQSGGGLHITRPCFAETYVSQVSIDASRTAVLVVRAKAYPTAETVPQAESYTPAALPSPQTQQLSVTEAPQSDKPKLQEANIIVSGGRGLQGPENFALVEDLASTLGAAVGASRAIVDAGWRPHSEQVGQTGKSVSPQVYFAVGISGAMQHLVGMNTSKTIIAINRDDQAPIFKIADFGIVGDALTVVPTLTAKLKAQNIKLAV